MKRSLSSGTVAELIGGKHGLRYSIASVLDTRSGTTAAELSEQLGVPAATIRRQLRILSRLGLVEMAEETARRGVAERSYRLAGDLIVDDDEFEGFSTEQKERIVRSILRVTLGDILRSIKAGLINRRTDRCVVRAPMMVDEQGWKELVHVHGRAFEEICRVREESERRLDESNDEPISTVSIQLFIELP